MTIEELIEKLAALFYYQAKSDDPKEKKKPFEKATEEQRSSFVQLAKTLLLSLDRMNMVVLPKAEVLMDAERVREIEDRVSETVKTFFNQITVWRKEMIPQRELELRIVRLIHELGLIKQGEK